MNEVYEAVAAFLKELRCDSMEREYAVDSEDIQQADSELKEANEDFHRYLSRLARKDKEYLERYMEIVDHSHFMEEQRAYYQGIVDGIQMIGGLGLIKESKNVEQLLKKIK